MKKIIKIMGVLGVMGVVGVLTVKSAFAIYDPLSVPNNKFGIHILETSEIEKAAELVNSSGGDWGYVTIPIRANERDLPKWTGFMRKATEKHIIPILRIASFPVDPPDGEASWMAPNEYDLVDFSNFLDQLPWPVKNRYVVIYNEPNHDGEWGGFVNPTEYARVLDRAIDIFHKRNPDFFVISAGMDASFDPYSYYQKMLSAWPEVLNKVDGLSFHAYGNPAFSTYPTSYNPVNIMSYKYEMGYLREMGVMTNKPIFITEAGWKNGPPYGEASWLKIAFENFWTDDNIVAITPFLLNAQTQPFMDFSFINQNGDFKPFAIEIMKISKNKGNPQIAKENTVEIVNKPAQKSSTTSSFSITQLFQKISDIIISWIGK